jgi:AraC-like DNA-binding protein
MSFFYEERLSDSPFVQTIWHTWTERNGCYLASADGSWDLLISRQDATTNVLLCGPTTKATPVYYTEGIECLGIRFQLGTYMPHLPTNHLLDAGTMLYEGASTSFWLGDSLWQFPDYENADTFVDRLVRADLLARDPVVDAVLQGHLPDLSPRSVQRHFLRTIGLPQRSLRSIERAQQAALLLQQGVSIQDTVFQAGYVDQAHLTKSVKRLTGQTPAQIAWMRKSEELSSRYKTMHRSVS